MGVKNNSENKTEINNIGSRLNKRRSSSTSYLNEKDDYDDDSSQDYYNGEYLKKFRRQLSLNETEQQKPNMNLDKLTASEIMSKQIQNNDINEPNDYSSDDSKSNESDTESNPDLYDIDECDELNQTCDQSSIAI